MGWESCSASAPAPVGGACSPSSSASPTSGGKRGRDPEDEVYLDNLHSHKRYLSEIMASSLNGLTVGDTLAENLMESPSRSGGLCCPREEFTVPYSPMSEDSDDSRFSETPIPTPMVQSDVFSRPTSPVSPHRHQKPLNGFSSSNPYPLPGGSFPAAVCTHPHPRHRGSDSEGRFPSSPNDMCHTADLRRAALLRSVQMRAQPHCPPAYELPFLSGQENMQNEEEAEDRPYSCMKAMDDETGYHSPEQVAEDYVGECLSVDGLSEHKLNEEDKCYGAKFLSERKCIKRGKWVL